MNNINFDLEINRYARGTANVCATERDEVKKVYEQKKKSTTPKLFN